MISSQKTSAHVYSTVEIDMTNLLNFKEKYEKIYSDKHSIKLTVTSLIIDACIKSLNKFPLLNASIDGIIQRYQPGGAAVNKSTIKNDAPTTAYNKRRFILPNRNIAYKKTR